MSMDPQLAPVRPGEILAGRYRVERVIGIGGMGIVVAAMHLQLEQLVALKFLLPNALESAVVVARFTREARAAIRIKSEHIARIMDVGTLESGAPYMVMEYLDGSDLAAVLRSNGRLPIEDAVDYILQACEAIAEAHRLGIVHRDIKPANLFLARTDGVESIKVLDFGISKMTSFTGSDSDVGTMTHTGVLLGSPMYMSPEQLTSPREVDTRTDIWSLGVVLHQLLAGEPPFSGTTVTQISIGVVQQPAPLLEEIRPEVSPRLGAAVRRCLEKNRAQRYANIEELATALQEFAPPRSRASVERIYRTASGPPIPAPASVDYPFFGAANGSIDISLGSMVPTATGEQTHGEWVGSTLRNGVRPGRRGRWLVIGGAGLAAAAFALWLLIGRAPRPTEPTVILQAASVDRHREPPMKAEPKPVEELPAQQRSSSPVVGSMIDESVATQASAMPATSARQNRAVVPHKAMPAHATRYAPSPSAARPANGGWEDER
jgi:serine/threonine protein kinase